MSLPMTVPAGTFTTEVYAVDVLFGRGSGSNDHEGNIRFRRLIAQRKDEYNATNHRQTKASIARGIVTQVLSEGGRFLRRAEKKDYEKTGRALGTDAWIVADEDVIMEKAKQALRQNAHKKKESEGISVKTNTPPPPQLQSFQSSTTIPLNNTTAGVNHRIPSYQDFEPLAVNMQGYSVASTMQQDPAMLQQLAILQQEQQALQWQQQQQQQSMYRVSGAVNKMTMPQQNDSMLAYDLQQQQQQAQQAHLAQHQAHPAPYSVPLPQPEDDDGMLAHLQLKTIKRQQSLDDQSLVDPFQPIPIKNSGFGRASENRSGSLSVDEVFVKPTSRVKNMEWSAAGMNLSMSVDLIDLMESFSKTKVSGGIKAGGSSSDGISVASSRESLTRSRRKDLNASTDTMGTIEINRESYTLGNMSTETIGSSLFDLRQSGRSNTKTPTASISYSNQDTGSSQEAMSRVSNMSADAPAGHRRTPSVEARVQEHFDKASHAQPTQRLPEDSAGNVSTNFDHSLMSLGNSSAAMLQSFLMSHSGSLGAPGEGAESWRQSDLDMINAMLTSGQDFTEVAEMLEKQRSVSGNAPK